MTAIATPDLSRRGMKKAFTVAIDAALDFHHKTFLPKHFKKNAPARYGSKAYANAQQYGKKRTKRKRTGGSKRRVTNPDGVTLGKEDTLDQIPLVHSGRSKNRILGGPIQKTGPAEVKRTMRIAAPKHFFYKVAGTINKVEAAETVLESESAVAVVIIDKQLQDYLDNNTTTKKG
jgi:hypothetical protein|tara:strand:+ start:331 stop:855 length:525 start_codon:yes stop_codon:yes gene_type:complete